MNAIGLTGFLISVFAAIGLGMLIENWRSQKPFQKYRHRYKPRKVPPNPEEWAIQRHEDSMTPEALARQFVEGKE